MIALVFFWHIQEIVLGAWIAEWYHTQLWLMGHCAILWAVSSSLHDDKFFLDPSTTSTFYSRFYFVYLVWYYYLSVKFVMWIVKQKIENKRNLFLKNILFFQWICPPYQSSPQWLLMAKEWNFPAQHLELMSQTNFSVA